jgi:hypothetical protein
VFAGYERSMRGGAGGDQNCVYRDPAEFSEESAAYPSVASWHDMYDAQLGIDVVAAPHTSAQCGGDATIDWPALADGDPRNLAAPLRLTEVYQAARESFEYAGCPRQYTGCVTAPDTGWVSVPLALGMRLGLICASDHGIRQAYQGVFAEDRTRDAIFAGLRERRTSGSTRTLRANLEFRVAGTLQGGEAVSILAPEVFVRVEAPAPLLKIEINKDGDPAWFAASFSGTDTTLTFTDPDPVVPGTSSFYYVRVTDQTGRLYWTSPVWVDFGSPTGTPDLPPTTARLSATAYPNPFAGEVRLQIEGMGQQGGRVRIHDVSGRLVRTFVVPGGRTAVTWDGRDVAGRSVAAGVYWAVTQSRGETARTRFVRIR